VLLDPYIGTARWRHLTAAPGARYAASMTARASSLLLFGGHGSVVLGDTWSWDGSRWTELHPAKSPSAREGAAIATLGTNTILFGGVDASLTKALDETWSFDGTTWTQLAPMHHPPALVYGTLLHAGGKLVLVGGKKPGLSTWVFDGTDWIENTSVPSPSFVYDGRAGVFADDGTTAFYTGGGDTWTFDGDKWTDHGASAGTPAVVAGVARIGGKMVLVALGANYEWNGTSWVSAGPAGTVPDSLRYATQYAMTSFGDGIAVYGGLSLAGALSDFVRFDTTGWNVPVNGAVPPARGFASLATFGDRAVLFGGWNGAVLADTWELDGTSWSQKKPAISPAPRYDAAFADGGDVALLFGGFAPDPMNDTWRWDHTSWTRATPMTLPPGGGAKLARIGTNDVLLAGSRAYVWTAGGNWAPQTAKAPDRVGKIVTGGDFSVLTSYQGQGILFVPELGTVWSYGPSGFQSLKADNLEAIGGATAVRPLLGDGGIDLGRYALLLGHRLGAIETESWLWDGKAFAQLAATGLPPLAQPAVTRLGADVVLFGGFDAASHPSSDTYLMRVALANGVECTADGDCDSAHCAQGVCCNSACTGATESCKQPATAGTCAPILAACSGPSTLQSADGTQKSCLPYLCVAGACLQKCTSSDECAGGTICDTPSSQCVASAPAESSGGCTVRTAKPNDVSAALGALLAAVLLRRRRQRR
ncbi:MAG: Kelch repeat-containing protein, partial [Polyangiales bacterium]